MQLKIRDIYLIDDDSDDQELFTTALSLVDSSVTCRTETNGLKALDDLTNQLVFPDLIFVDLNMPLLNGFEFLQFMQSAKLNKPIPIVVYSTASDDLSRQKSKELGAYDFVTKPNTFQGLMNMLEGYLKTTPIQKA
jgi:CheY-like chemotaxis protein